MENKKIVIVGSGAFGTAMGNQFVKNVDNVVIYGVDPEEIKDINENHKNSKYYHKKLDPKLTATLDPTVFADADIIVIGLPSHIIAGVVKDTIIPNLKQKATFINLSKGYDYINQMTLVESIEKELPAHLNDGVMKLSGPSFAIDVVRNKLTYFDLASHDLEKAECIAKSLTTDTIKIHATDKLFETELNSMLKNPLAILMGIIDGLGYKENTRAAMFTACIVEMQHIVKALGGDESKVVSPSGIGDFFLTGTSKKSRNYSTGYKLGKLNKVNKKILNTFATTEGLKVLENIMTILNKEDIKSPLLELLFNITSKRQEPKKTIEKFFENLK